MTANKSTNSALNPNSTNADQTPWIAGTTADAVCFLLALWIFVSFLCYGLRTRKFTSHTKPACTLYISASATAFLTTVYLAIKTTLDLRWQSNEICNQLSKTAVEMYAVCTTSIYVFLWFKQRSLYKQQLLSHLYVGWVVVVSYLSIILVVAGLNIASIVFNIVKVYGASEYGCQQRNTFKWPFMVASGINASGQVMMLFLFLYPFRCAENKPRTGSGLRLLKRTLATTLLCITTDAVTGFVNAFVPYAAYRTPYVAYGPTTTLNLVAVMLTFETWQDILISPARRPDSSRNLPPQSAA